MSADNFYVVKGNKVWMGSESELCWAQEEAERHFYRKLLRGKPIFVGESEAEADHYAYTEYSEYGVYALPEGLESA